MTNKGYAKRASSAACITGCVALIAGCSSQPPISISEIGDAYKGLSCDYDEPACQKQYEAARDKAAELMKGTEVKPFYAQITSISESSKAKNTWDIRARVVWDQAEENSQAMFNAGMLTGLLTLGGEGGSIIKESLKQPEGKCLTSLDPGYKGVAKINMDAYEVKLTSLDGAKEGATIMVSGGKVVPMGGEDGWLKTRYTLGSDKSFGSVELGINKPLATVSAIKQTHETCPTTR